MSDTDITYKAITPEALTEARRRLDTLNRRITRRGLDGIYHLEATEVWVSRNVGGLTVNERRFDVRITGTPPRYHGWTLLGMAEWDAHAGLITRLIPGVERVDRDTLKPGWCDHCRTARNRTRTYILTDEAGTQRQVGSTCLNDFLGWDSSKLVPLPPLEDELEREFDGLVDDDNRGEVEYHVTDIIAIAYAVTLTMGYRPASSDHPTRDIVAAILDGKVKMEDCADQEHLLVAGERAEEIVAFITGPDFGGNSDYVLNLKAAAGAQSCTRRTWGLLASAPQAWMKATGQQREEREQLLDEFVGQEGDRVTVEVTVIDVNTTVNRFGYRQTTTWIYTMAGDDKRRYKWFASKPALGRETGATATVTGRVKGHDQWQGRKSTVLTRCKVEQLQEQQAPAAA